MRLSTPMRGRRTLGALVAAAALGGPLAVAGTAAGPAAGCPAATSAYRCVDAYVPVLDGPAGRHRAVMDVRLYLPRSATPRHPEPAVVMTNGFGLSKDAAEITSTADFLARHGYVVLTYTGQGFGDSSGCIQLDSADYDVKDAVGLIHALLATGRYAPLVAHDRRGPIVGMVGGSYGGAITENVAEQDPAVRAIVPGRTWNSLQYALYPNNWVVSATRAGGFDHQLTGLGVFKGQWTSLFYADGNAADGPRSGANGNCQTEKAAAGDAAGAASCPGYPDALCTAYAEIAATGTAPDSVRALLSQSSPETHIAALHAATLLMQGESDTLFNEDDAVATYLELRARHVPVAMIWNYGGHGGYNSQPGECDVYGGGDTGLDSCYLTLRTLAWFDHYLKHLPVSTGPGFAYYRDWVKYAGRGPDTAQYGTARAFPAQQMMRYGLTGGGAMVPAGLALASGSASFIRDPALPPSYSETSDCSAPQSSAPPCPGNALSSAPASDTPGEFTSFTSPPFPGNVVSAGVPTAHLFLSHVNGQDLIMFAKVYDVAPDGSATLIKRLIAPVRIPNAALAHAVDIKLLGFAHLFRAGHAVRLVLAATDATSTIGAADNAPDDITVYYGALPGAPSTTPTQELGNEDPANYSSFSFPVNDLRMAEPYN